MGILYSSVKSNTVPISQKKKQTKTPNHTRHFYMFWVPLAIDLAHISYPNTGFNKSSDCSPDFLKLTVMDAEILGATDIQNIAGLEACLPENRRFVVNDSRILMTNINHHKTVYH